MNKQSNKVLSLLMLVVGMLLVGFSAGRWLAPLAAWIGPVLIMRFYRDHRPGRGFLLLIAIYTLAFLIGFGRIWTTFNLGPWFAPILGVFYGFLWSLPLLADRLANSRLPGFSSTLVYPLAATSLEFVNIHTNPVGTWGATGFSQYGDLALMQLASVTGMVGITFLMGWFASVVNWAWENQRQGGGMLKGLAAFGVVLVAVYAFGFLRLNLAPLTATDETVRVAGVIAESQSTFFENAGELNSLDAAPMVVQAHWDVYFDETVREAKAGARLVLWPEYAGLTSGTQSTTLITRAQEVARENGIYLGLSVGIFYPSDTGQLAENKLLLIDPSGEIVLEHFKYGGHIFEGNRIQGDGKLQTVNTPFGNVSGIICYDADYPAVVQQVGLDGTGLLLVPSADWLEIDPVHTYMAVFRAIENGTSLIRVTERGLSIVVDPYGRPLAQTDFFGAADRTLVAQVPVKHVATIYTAFGRWFEWLCLAGFVIVIAWALIAPRRIA